MLFYFSILLFFYCSIHCMEVIDGFTPLHHAAFNNEFENIKQLLNEGHEVDCLDDQGRTPLQIAVEQNKFEAVKLLVERGADFNCSSGDTTPFLSSVLCSNNDIAEFFLNSGADIDSRDHQQNTVLHIALKPEHFPPSKKLDNPFNILQLFLKYGADPNARNRLQQTPLHLCAHFNDCTQVAALLVMHGADINAQQHAGLTPLHTCSRLGFWKMVKYLLREDANPDIASKRAETPLHHAVMALWRIDENNIRKVINLLINAQVEINPINRDNKTPMDILCYDMDVITPQRHITTHLKAKGGKRAFELIANEISSHHDHRKRCAIQQ